MNWREQSDRHRDSSDESLVVVLVVAGGFDSVLRVWNGANGQVLHELSPAPALAEPVAVEKKQAVEKK